MREFQLIEELPIYIVSVLKQTAPTELNCIISQIFRTSESYLYWQHYCRPTRVTLEEFDMTNALLQCLSDYDLHIHNSKNVFFKEFFDYLGYIAQYNKIIMS